MKRLVLGTALLSLLVSVAPASPVESNRIIENCRRTFGRPIFIACMRSGGSNEACRSSARPRVRACVSAMGGQRGMRTFCNPAKKMSGAPCL
jgi:hypothetical protein